MVASLEAYRSRLKRVSRDISRSTRPSQPDDSSMGSPPPLRHGVALPPELCSDALTVLDPLIREFIRQVPHRESDALDAASFLEWLDERQSLSGFDQDIVRSLYSQHAVEQLSLQKRLAQARFEALVAEHCSNRPLAWKPSHTRVHLNPIHIWARLETRLLLDEEVTVPATVLFYRDGHQVRTAVIERDEERLLKMLERKPLKLAEVLECDDQEEQGELLDMLRQLQELHLVALSRC